MIGRIVKFPGGWGFVRPIGADRSQDTFIHQNDVDFVLHAGALIHFEIVADSKGRRRAGNVRAMEEWATQ